MSATVATAEGHAEWAVELIESPLPAEAYRQRGSCRARERHRYAWHPATRAVSHRGRQSDTPAVGVDSERRAYRCSSWLRYTYMLDTPAVGVDSPEQLGEGPSSYSVARRHPENMLPLWRPPCRASATALGLSVVVPALPLNPSAGSRWTGISRYADPISGFANSAPVPSGWAVTAMDSADRYLSEHR